MEVTQTVSDIRTLGQLADLIEDLGYEVGRAEDFLAVKVPASGREPFTAIFTIDDLRNKLVITMDVAHYDNVPEDRMLTFLAAQSDANTRIDPFAFATITDLDDPERASAENWIFVLRESLPLGDLSPGEVQAIMEDLNRAMPEVLRVLKMQEQE